MTVILAVRNLPLLSLVISFSLEVSGGKQEVVKSEDEAVQHGVLPTLLSQRKYWASRHEILSSGELLEMEEQMKFLEKLEQIIEERKLLEMEEQLIEEMDLLGEWLVEDCLEDFCGDDEINQHRSRSNVCQSAILTAIVKFVDELLLTAIPKFVDELIHIPQFRERVQDCAKQNHLGHFWVVAIFFAIDFVTYSVTYFVLFWITAMFVIMLWNICRQLVKRRSRKYALLSSHLDEMDGSRAEALQGQYTTVSCPICWGAFQKRKCGENVTQGSDGQSVKLLRCGHVFDKSCWDEWIANGTGPIHKCPICKQDVAKGQNGFLQHKVERQLQFSRRLVMRCRRRKLRQGSNEKQRPFGMAGRSGFSAGGRGAIW